MTRRELFAASLAAASLGARPRRIDRSRISAISDEIARTPAAAIAFLKQYNLQWVELRGVPDTRKEYSFLPEEETKKAAAEFQEAGIRVSFLNASLLKFAWPGTEPVRRRPETPEQRATRLANEQRRWDNRFNDLRTACRNAHILGVDKVRVFAGSRVADVPALMPRIIVTIGEFSEVAGQEKIHLLLENEGSCNVATSAELAAVMKGVSSKWAGINWDPHNELSQPVKPFPEGYGLLPKKRLGNVQIKGRSVIPGEAQLMDWAGIFHALERDGYQGQIGLETHIFGEVQVQKSHESMKAILRLVEHA